MVRWLRTESADGQRTFRMGRDGDFLLAEWEGLATLRASRTGEWSEVTVAPGIDPRYADKFVRGVVTAFIEALKGRLSLHAGTIARGARAVACIGESGAGKSTLAAALCRDDHLEFVSDDVAPIEFDGDRALVIPCESAHWLTEEASRALSAPTTGGARARKGMAAAARVLDRPATLAGIVSLAYEDRARAPTLRRVGGHESFPILSAAVMRIPDDAPETQRRDLDRIARLANAVPLYVLARPRGFAWLPATRALVIGLLEAAS